MSRLTVTNFNKRTGSPFQSKSKEPSPENTRVVQDIVLEKTHYEKQKEKQSELMQKVNKKAAEYQANKPSSGVFTEVVTHGAFTSKTNKEKTPPIENVNKGPNGSNGSKQLLGFPSSANDLALDAKTDLESDPNISKEVKEKVIQKLFKLVSMVQHVYESKVRIMTEFEKFKDTHLKAEVRREKEYSEQLYKLNMNFQNEVVQAIQRLKSEMDITRNATGDLEQRSVSESKNSSVDFNTHDAQDSPNKNSDDVTDENKSEHDIITQSENIVNT
ncbi:unnamed protein product [Diatraea saccharalis]|uniref:Uncharacterized protein n=1 Tax=Diatraea saccharalis TaxID=40085 RepID=A0A9N9REK0_9NEOP|nr:unnamed protein product [Diatraea saccharalis]